MEEFMIARGKMKVAAIVIIASLSIFLGACANSEAAQPMEKTLLMAPLKDLPKEVQSAPLTVQQAYQFAVANPDLMTQIPCYCGCGGMGHGSNYACYVQDTSPDGEIVFDGHALGCSICVDITLDAMRMHKQGESLAGIQDYVDLKYARFGPSNMP